MNEWAHTVAMLSLHTLFHPCGDLAVFCHRCLLWSVFLSWILSPLSSIRRSRSHRLPPQCLLNMCTPLRVCLKHYFSQETILSHQSRVLACYHISSTLRWTFSPTFEYLSNWAISLQWYMSVISKGFFFSCSGTWNSCASQSGHFRFSIVSFQALISVCIKVYFVPCTFKLH